MQVWLVAVDLYGNAQASATSVALTTLPDTTPPVLLQGSGPQQVSATATYLLLFIQRSFTRRSPQPSLAAMPGNLEKARELTCHQMN